MKSEAGTLLALEDWTTDRPQNPTEHREDRDPIRELHICPSADRSARSAAPDKFAAEYAAGRTAEAVSAYQRALELAQNEVEKRFLNRRLEELSSELSRD